MIKFEKLLENREELKRASRKNRRSKNVRMALTILMLLHFFWLLSFRIDQIDSLFISVFLLSLLISSLVQTEGDAKIIEMANVIDKYLSGLK